MPKFTAKSDRRRSPGEGTVYRHRSGHRGALTWTEPDGTRCKRLASARTSAEIRAADTPPVSPILRIPRPFLGTLEVGQLDPPLALGHP